MRLLSLTAMKPLSWMHKKGHVMKLVDMDDLVFGHTRTQELQLQIQRAKT